MDLTAKALPTAVVELAQRLGAVKCGPPVVRLTQAGTMREKPGDRVMAFNARQTIDLHRPAFRWEASTGPFGCISVIDAFENGTAALEVRAFWLLRLASAGGAAAAKGEAMRYLAELAWAPDAILQNSALNWTVVNSTTIRVGLRLLLAMPKCK